MLAHKTLVCPRCGNLRSECSDPDRDWHPRLDDCYASAAIAFGWRKMHKKYPADAMIEDAHPLDGTGMWVSQQPQPEGEEPIG